MKQYSAPVHQFVGMKAAQTNIPSAESSEPIPAEGLVCPLCSDTVRPWLRVPGDWRRPDSRESYTLFWCERCAYGCVYPRPDAEALASFYAIDSYYTHDAKKSTTENTSTSFLDRVRCHLAWRLDKGRPISGALVQEVLKGRPGKICDLGCGGGALLNEVKSLGYDVVGVEPDPAARQLARDRGLTVHDGTAEQLPPELEPASFDMVLMSHALEHCLDPVNALCNARSLLKSSGVLLCETPNSEAHGLSHAGITWFWLDVPRHLNFFTERSITGACSRAGFKVVETQVTGYYRQFTPGWIDAERHIWDVFEKSGATLLPAQSSSWRSWKLLARTAFANRGKKYDSVRVVAHPEFYS
jgi:2-polyprenyl-3-methyl-5-hydroxy-6-metoxy-1,4-benzoquinol methylase